MATTVKGNLGIRGLAPGAGSLRGGRVYLLSGGSPALCRRIVLESVLASLTSGSVCIITDGDPAALFDSPRAHPTLTAIPKGDLQVLEPAADPEHSSRRHDTLEILLDEVEHHVSRHPRLIVWHNPGTLLGGGGRAPDRRMERLRERARQRRWAVLLVADSLSIPLSTLFGPVASWREELAGLVLLGGNTSHATIEVAHWHEEDHTIAGRRFICRDTRDGLVAEEEDQPPRSTPITTVPLQEVVYTTHRAVDDAPSLPDTWKTFDTLDALIEALVDGLTGCVILHHDRSSAPHELLHTVTHLRQQLGAGTPILVRERNATIRYRDEQMLLRAGITTVVPRDTGFSSFVRICEALHSREIHHPSLAVDPAWTEEGMTETGRGYLPAERFIPAVERLMEESGEQGIRSALIRLAPLPGISLADTVRACSPTRTGDLCTTDRENLYLFLHACRGSDIDTALSHVFLLPPAQLFDWDERNVTHSDIREALRHLQEALLRHPLPDYSDLQPLTRVTGGENPATVVPHPRAHSPTPATAHPEPLFRRTAGNRGTS